jgi:hypothetical protein
MFPDISKKMKKRNGMNNSCRPYNKIEKAATQNLPFPQQRQEKNGWESLSI